MLVWVCHYTVASAIMLWYELCKFRGLMWHQHIIKLIATVSITSESNEAKRFSTALPKL